MKKFDLVRLGVLRDVSEKAYLCVVGLNNRFIVPKSVVVCRQGSSGNYWIKGFFTHKIDVDILCSHSVDDSFVVDDSFKEFLNGLYEG